MTPQSREALLVAAAHRIVELHHADMDRATQHHTTTVGTSSGADITGRLTDLLTESLLTAATTLRTRYQAIYELQLEALRRPALARALAGLHDISTQLTADHHTALGLPILTEAIPTLITLYGGTLFALVTGSADRISRQFVRSLARAMVHGALSDLDDNAPTNHPPRGR